MASGAVKGGGGSRRLNCSVTRCVRSVSPKAKSRKRYEERHGFRRDVGPDGYPLDPRHPGFDHEGAASKGADLGAGDDPDEIEVDPDADFEV